MYHDCLFFIGSEVAPSKKQDIDPKFQCIMLKTLDLNGKREREKKPTGEYTQIRPVNRITGDFRLDENYYTWVLLRMPENQQIKIRARRIIITNDLSNREGFELSVRKQKQMNYPLAISP